MYSGGMKTQKAVRLAKGIAALARLFSNAGHPCTRQAVQQWGEDLPELRIYQLKEIRPGWFKAARKGA